MALVARKVYICLLISVFLYSIVISFLNVLEEPTTFEEIEIENYATLPSGTFCRRSEKMDTLKTFDDVVNEVNNFSSIVFASFSKNDKEALFTTINQDYGILEALNTTFEDFWEVSAIIQPEKVDSIIPCITVNFPRIPQPERGSYEVSISFRIIEV